MSKIFFLDTNVLMDDPSSIDFLYENGENRVIIPYSVVLELDRLKKNVNKSHLVFSVIDKLKDCPAEFYKRDGFNYTTDNCSDNTILDDIKGFILKNPNTPCIFITNDKLLRIRTKIELNIEAQEFNESKPFLSDTELYTGVIDEGDDIVKNCFYWKEGKLYFENENKLINYENEIWKVRPRTVYQNMLMELLMNNDIDVVTVQSMHGFGKTMLTLAAALQLTFQRDKRINSEEIINNSPTLPKKRGRKKKTEQSHNNYKTELFSRKKIFIVRPTTIIGDELGFLPGDLSEKIDPFFRPIKDMLMKLHEMRPCYKLFVDGDPKKGFDRNVIEFIPITFLRGMNIENSIVIIDETQNLSKHECKTLLSRMGEGVRCFLTGDKNK